jgi:hypothetical protein
VVVVPETALRTRPDAESEVLETLKQEQIVTLLGQVSGTWVKVETPTGVAPGWVYAPHLERRAVVPTATAAVAPTSDQSQTNDDEETDSADGPSVVIEPLALVDEPSSPPPAAATTLTVTVRVNVAETRASQRPPVAASPIAKEVPPVPPVRVQLVDVFGDVLTEAITGFDGQVQLRSVVHTNAAVWLQLPHLGLRVPLEGNDPTVHITLPPSLLGAVQ